MQEPHVAHNLRGRVAFPVNSDVTCISSIFTVLVRRPAGLESAHFPRVCLEQSTDVKYSQTLRSVLVIVAYRCDGLALLTSGRAASLNDSILESFQSLLEF